MSHTFILVEDQPLVRDNLLAQLKSQYPDAKVLPTGVAEGVEEMVSKANPDLIIMDLSIPFDAEAKATYATGIALIERLLREHTDINFAVRSVDPKNLVRLKREIENHNAGFVIIDKALPEKDILERIDWALKGVNYTREIRGGPELKKEWKTVLHLAFNEALTDEAIAQEMNLAIRTVRVYWSKAQDALEIYPDKRYNRRIQTYNKVRQLGFLD